MNRVGGQARGRKAAEPGFSLIEMAIAIAIIAFTFIGLIGLMGLGVTNDHTSSEQTAANNIAASILADLRSTPVYATTSTRYGMTLPTSPANATTPINTSAAPLGGIKPVSLYFDNSPAFISMNPSSVPSNAVYVANVYLTRMGYVGASSIQSNDLARVVVSWPAQVPTGTAPAGSVEVISQFLIH